MVPRSKRSIKAKLTIAAVICGCAALAVALALRDHAAGWRFLMQYDTVEISPTDPEDVGTVTVDAVVIDVKLEQELAILGAGREQGVKSGDQFLIHREDLIVGLARAKITWRERSDASIVWSGPGMEVRKGDRASAVSLVRALAAQAGVPVIMHVNVAVKYARSPWRSVEALTAETVLEILREAGWRIVEQRVPRRAYIILGTGTHHG